MNVDKARIIDLLTSQGDHAKAERAQAELPGTVDTDQYAGLLDQLGVNIAHLTGKLPGGMGDKLGALGLGLHPAGSA
ncbi:MAG TPA: hypothetical protein VFP34_03110 [Microlunatus sp.]|nr:hypothetical protein [Microlunatus sp.]